MNNKSEKKKIILLICACSGACPSMEKIDFWTLSERIRLEIDDQIEFLALHPKLCEEDGERFMGQAMPSDAIIITSACAEKKQEKLLRDGFANAGVEMDSDHWIPINMAQEDTHAVFEKIKKAVQAKQQVN